LSFNRFHGKTCAFFTSVISVIIYTFLNAKLFQDKTTQKWGKKCMKNTGLNKNCVCP
jgi:hypothetical protein